MKHRNLIVCALVATLSPLHAQAAISGSAPGAFVLPVGPSGRVISGVGTSTVNFGVPCNGVTNCWTSPGGITPPDRLVYQPRPFTAAIGESFVLGTIEFFNGTIMPGTEINSITLSVAPIFDPSDDALPSISGTRVINIVNTPNGADPIASADFLTIAGNPSGTASEFHVLESSSAVATILARFAAATDPAHPGVALEIVGFRNLSSGSGFIVHPVPIPPAFGLLVSAFAVLRCRRTRSRPL